MTLDLLKTLIKHFKQSKSFNKVFRELSMVDQTVTKIQQYTRLEQCVVSQNLARFRSANLVICTRIGKERYYKLNIVNMLNFISILEFANSDSIEDLELINRLKNKLR